MMYQPVLPGSNIRKNCSLSLVLPRYFP